VKSDPREVAEVEKALLKIAQPLANAARPVVAELLKSRQQVSTKAFLEGMEHTALRTGYLLTGDLDLAIAVAKQPDAGGIPLPFQAKVKELMLFAASEEHFELRQRLGTAIGG
jgi:hypothetical protein